MSRITLLLVLGTVLLAASLGCDSGEAVDAGMDTGPSRDAGRDAEIRPDGAMDAGPETDAASDTGTDAASDAGTDAASDAGPPSPSFDDRVAALSDPAATTEDLDALIHEVTWAEGWPVTDGSRWLFATRWDAAPAEVVLVSDINTWDSARAPATRAASGVHYWAVVAEATFDAPAAGAKYKWRGLPDINRAPPEARAYGFDTFGEFGYVAPPTSEAWRERFDGFASAHLEERRAFRALLPAGFAHADAARVLFLHDGQNVFHPDSIWGGWRVDEALAAAGYEDVVVLTVDNAGDRMDAYTHVVDDIGGGAIGGRAEDYAGLVFDEALPFFRAHYGLRASRDDLVIGGSSLGGLVSLYFALTRPAEMRCVIAMSSSLGWGAIAASATGADALVNRWTTHGTVAVYLDSGGGGTCSDTDGDGVQEDSADSDDYCTTTQLRDHLDGLGYTFGTDLAHWWESGAAHNEAAWAARMPNALSSCVAAGWAP
ncbi:MAG: hypothetical protein DRJ42_13345 [Deltaproteobacteria bacterium]|nr:MAG: hypothetical protein DRJ42_13345 [Deltaproteobacteria bacterium]